MRQIGEGLKFALSILTRTASYSPCILTTSSLILTAQYQILKLAQRLELSPFVRILFTEICRGRRLGAIREEYGTATGWEVTRALKRPSQGKLKLANSCWKTSKSWQTRLHTSNSCQITNTVIRNMAVFLSAVALTYNSETEEKKRRNRKRWRNRKVWTKPSLSAVLFCLFLFVSL